MRYALPTDTYPPVGPTCYRGPARVREPDPDPWSGFLFTSREREVAGRLVLGDSNKETARHLSIQVATVRFHIGNILKKTQADNRTRAALRLATSYSS